MRAQAPGAPLVEGEAERWRQKLKGFMQISQRNLEEKKKKKSKSDVVPMLSNVLVAKALDRSLLVTTGEGLQKFYKEKLPSLFLEDGFERQFVHGVGNPYEDRHRSSRSVVMSLLSKERHYELEKVHWPELHTCADCGSVGFEMSMWLYTRGGICGTHITDVFAHDMHNSVKRACVQSGLWLLMLEYTLVANYTRAPFHSDSNFETFQQAATDMFQYLRQEKNDPFGWFSTLRSPEPWVAGATLSPLHNSIWRWYSKSWRVCFHF